MDPVKNLLLGRWKFTIVALVASLRLAFAGLVAPVTASPGPFSTGIDSVSYTHLTLPTIYSV